MISSDDLLHLMSSRSSGRDSPRVLADQDLVTSINELIVRKIPSGGDFRSIVVVLSESGNLAIVCKDIRPITYKYGVFALELVLQEAGYLAAWVNLYLMTRGYHVLYLQHPTSRSYSFTVAELSLSQR